MAEYLLSMFEASDPILVPLENVSTDIKRQNLGISRDYQPTKGVGSELAVSY